MARKESEQLEKSLTDLQDIVENMEQGSLSLDESLKQFEKGIKLSQQCQKTLSEAEQKVETLLKDNNDS